MAKAEELYKITAKQLFEESKNRDIIPCCLSMDIGLGGGIPRGGMILIGGKEKIGKSTIAMQYAANSQKLYKNNIYVFTPEGRLTHMTMKQVQGLDLDKVQVVKPEPILDKTGKIIGVKKMSSEQYWNAIGQTILDDPGCFIIVDSIANMSSEKEQSESMGFQDRGGRNKLESEFCRKFGSYIQNNRVTLVLITQIQANTSGMGASTQLKCGNSIRFQSDVILHGKWVEKWPEQDGRILGHDIHYKVEVSALGPPHAEIVVPLRYGYGIDNIKDVITHAITWGYIVKGGAWYSLPFAGEEGKEEYTEDYTNKNIVKLQGEVKVHNWFMIRPDKLKMIEDKIRAKVFL